MAAPVDESTALRPGVTIAGRFVIEGPLAEGAMGSVYLAHQEPMGRKVALKVIQKHLVSDPVIVKRFLREAVAISKLEHPNTVTLYDFGRDDDGRAYLAMQLVEGTSLLELLSHEGRLSVRRTARIVTQIGLSLAEAHRKGVIHRDLKPANIMVLDLDGQPDFVKIIDFGVAQLVDRAPGGPITDSGVTCGTPEYMSPEQLSRGAVVDHRSDLYSLGIIAYELLEGRRPFPAPTVVAGMVRKYEGEPEPMSESIPRALREFVLRLIAPKPSERPASAEAMLVELKAAIPPGVRLPIELETDRSSTTTRKLEVPFEPDAEEPAQAVDDDERAPPPRKGSSSLDAQIVEATGLAEAARRSRDRLAALLLGALVIVLGGWGIYSLTSSPQPPSAPSPPSAADPLSLATNDPMPGPAEADATVPAESGVPAESAAAEPQAPPLPTGLGGRCDQDVHCESGNCSHGVCSPPGYAYIAPGQLAMGTPGSSDEPAHRVTLTRGFFLSRHEVTQREWSRLMDRLNTNVPDCGPDCPAENNRWEQSAAYLNALSRSEGLEACYALDRHGVEWPRGFDCQGYRFPTEAEWEYAARAGAAGAECAGAVEPSDACLEPVAWYRNNAGGTARPVGLKPPNALGLHDMLGNAWEWVWDRYGDYGPEPRVDPTGPARGDYHVRRGCSYRSSTSACGVAVRNTYGRAGLRPARSVPLPNDTGQAGQRAEANP